MKLVLKNTSLDFKYVKIVRETLQASVVSNTSAGAFTKLPKLSATIPSGTVLKTTVSLSSYTGTPRVLLIGNFDVSYKLADESNVTGPIVTTNTVGDDITTLRIQLLTSEAATYNVTVVVEYEEPQE